MPCSRQSLRAALSDFGLARPGDRPTFATQRASLLVLAGFCLLAAVATIGCMPRPPVYSHGLHPFIEIRHFATTTLMICAGLGWAHFGWKGLTRIFGGFSLLAPVPG